MAFDPQKFDREQRRKALRQARSKPVAGKPRPASLPKRSKPKPRSKRPVAANLTPEERQRRAAEGRIGLKNAARSEAAKDQECQDILNILLIMKEKMGK